MLQCVSRLESFPPFFLPPKSRVGVGAEGDGPCCQSTVSRHVLWSGRAAGGPVYGGQLSLSRIGVIRRHRPRMTMSLSL